MRRFIMLLVIAYLIAEMAFNTYLLNITGTLSGTIQIHDLERWGRIMAATGFLVVLLFGSVKKHRTMRQTVSRLILFTVIAWPLVFYGERGAINALVDTASPATQASAYRMVWMRQAVARHAIAFPGVTYPLSNPNPTDKTFLAMIALVGNINPRIASLVHQDFPSLVRKTAEQGGAPQAQAGYAGYQRFYAALWSGYQDYAQASDSLGRGLRHPRAGAQALWQQANQGLATTGWARYRAGEYRYWHTLRQAARGIQPELVRFIQQLNNCEQSMICPPGDVVSQYRSEAQRVIDPAPAWWVWCGSFHPQGTLVSGRFFGHAETFLEPTPFDNNALVRYDQRGQQVCDPTVGHVTRILSFMDGPAFAARAGIAPGLQEAVFLNSPAATQALRQVAEHVGAVLPAHWTYRQGRVWRQAVAQAFQAHGAVLWRQRMRAALRTNMPPGLSWSAFLATPVIHQRILQVLGTDLPPGLDWARFHQLAVDPVLMTKTAQAVQVDRRIAAGQDPAVGREAVLGMVVPPIALLVSLTMALANITALIFAFLDREERFSFEGLIVLPHILRRYIPHKYRRNYYVWVSTFLRTALPWTMIAVIPFWIPNSLSDTLSHSALFQASSWSGEIVMGLMRWLIHAEPAFYTIGHWVHVAWGNAHEIRSHGTWHWPVWLTPDYYWRLTGIPQSYQHWQENQFHFSRQETFWMQGPQWSR